MIVKDNKNEVVTPQRLSLPLDGMSGFKSIQPFVNMSRETWRKRCIAGTAPQPIHLSMRCVKYKNSEVHAFLADPVNYRAEVVA